MRFIEEPQDLINLVSDHKTSIGIGLFLLFFFVWFYYEVKNAYTMPDDYEDN